MDADRFDSLIRGLQGAGSRRSMLAGLGAGMLAGLLARAESEAKKKAAKRGGGKRRGGAQGKRRDQDKKRKQQGEVGGEVVVDACRKLCELLFQKGTKRNRCLERAAAHPELCQCVTFCPRVYRRDLRRQLACLDDALNGDPDSICLRCGADPDRFCDGACCAEPGQCVDGVCDEDDPDLCANVVCEAQNQCHDPGQCDPSDGMCSDPAKPDGTACDNGQASPCETDVCQGGQCVREDVPTCCEAAEECAPPTDPCRRATCVDNECGDESIEGCIPCGSAQDCPGPQDSCRLATCVEGVCGEELVACPDGEICDSGICTSAFCAGLPEFVCVSDDYPFCNQPGTEVCYCLRHPDGSRNCLANSGSCFTNPKCVDGRCPDGWICATSTCCNDSTSAGADVCFPPCSHPLALPTA